MNNIELIKRLAELSGMARGILIATDEDHTEVMASNIEDILDDIVESLQHEERLEHSSRFQSLHPCNHQWKQSAPHEFMCLKCGERGD